MSKTPQLTPESLKELSTKMDELIRQYTTSDTEILVLCTTKHVNGIIYLASSLTQRGKLEYNTEDKDENELITHIGQIILDIVHDSMKTPADCVLLLTDCLSAVINATLDIHPTLNTEISRQRLRMEIANKVSILIASIKSRISKDHNNN